MLEDNRAPSQEATEHLDPSRANALLAALGQLAALSAGDPLPPFFHQLYFWQALPPALLGRDGHPRQGVGPIPETGLPRRMWAGGQLEFLRPLRLGEAATKRTRMESLAPKEGRSGKLVFVRLSHEVFQGGTLCLREGQDLVYREDGVPSQPSDAPSGAEAEIERDFDTTLLFRYSALTFNGHRIHYDETYAREVEGYAGLVVHGPLLAQCLMLWAMERLGPLRSFSFRAMSPLLHTERVRFCASGSGFWVAGPDGRLVMTAEALA